MVGMDFLVKVDDYFGASSMVDVKLVNILELMGSSEKSYLELIGYLVSKKGKFRVMTTTDPAGFDFNNMEGMGIEPDCTIREPTLPPLLLSQTPRPRDELGFKTTDIDLLPC